MLKSSYWNANLQLLCIKVILCRRSADRLDRLLLAIKPVVENRHSTGTDAAEVDRCNFASWHRCGYMYIFRLAVFFRLIFGWQKFGGWARYRLRLGALSSRVPSTWWTTGRKHPCFASHQQLCVSHYHVQLSVSFCCWTDGLEHAHQWPSASDRESPTVSIHRSNVFHWLLSVLSALDMYR